MSQRLAASVVVVLFGALGLAMFAVPDRVAGAFGLPGTDEFAYRSGGAAFLGYAIAFLYGWASDEGSRRILWLATYVAAVATAIAAVVGYLGQPSAAGAVVFAGALIASVATGWAANRSRPRAPERTARTFATWFQAFIGWGVVASVIFGLGGFVLGSTFGKLLGFMGTDDPIYRLAGAATIGILVGSLLALRTQDWHQVRLPVVVSFATNVLTLVAGALLISHGAVPLAAYAIAAAALFNVVGLGLALAGRHSSPGR